MLISKDENLKTSVVYVGYLILKQFQKIQEEKLSIFEITKHYILKKLNQLIMVRYSKI